SYPQAVDRYLPSRLKRGEEIAREPRARPGAARVRSSPRAAILTAAVRIAPRTCRTPRIGGAARPRGISGRTKLRRQSLQRSDAILGRWMGREQVVHPVAGQRIDDEEMRGRRRALGGGVLDHLRGGGNLRQRRRERVRLSGGAGAEFVG